MPADSADLGPFTLPRSSCHLLTAANGGRYRVLLAWPERAPSEHGLPVIYLLDAGASFGSLVETLRLRTRRSDATGVVPAVIVGIDHGDSPDARLRRTFDYTDRPAHDPALVDGDPSGTAATGGAAAFLAFLHDDVASFVDRTLPVPIDRRRASLFGHSMSGLFTLQVLLRAPDAFANYVAISPSIWWDRPSVFDAARQLADDTCRLLATRRLFVGVAEYDQALAPWQEGTPAAAAIADRRRQRRMVDDARAAAEALGTLTAETVFELFTGEDHASVVTRGWSSGLRFCLGALPRPTS